MVLWLGWNGRGCVFFLQFYGMERGCMSKTITVQGVSVTLLNKNQADYISLTDIANAKEGEARAADVIKNWIRNRGTLEFIGTWEQMYNPDFKVVEFDHFKMNAGLPSFVLSPGHWIEKTNAVGIIVKAGRYGGTYAHKDIAFEFCSSISPVFKLYLIKEFQRLKEEENNRLNLGCNIQRTLNMAIIQLKSLFAIGNIRKRLVL
jgi:hypothetical protein